MSDFDPYHKWLGIPETARPVSKYRLLAIEDFESDREVISAAAEQRTVYLRMLQAGEHAVLVAELLNEVSQARVTLLNADQKAEYDEELRKQQTPEPVSEPTPVPIPVVQTPAPVVVRGTVTQEFPVSVVQPAKKPRRRKSKEIWKQPVVIGVSVLGVIGVLVLVISLMFSANTLPPSLQEGLVAYYPFNGNANDESGNGNDAVVSGATSSVDRHGREDAAYHFDMPGDCISQTQDGATPLGLSDCTICLWVYPEKLIKDAHVLLANGVPDAYQLALDYSNTPTSRPIELIIGGSHHKSQTMAWQLDMWYHLIVVQNQDRLSFFRDGENIGDDEVTASNQAPRGERALVFAARGNAGHQWTGDIDDIRIYNRALSAAEVKALYEYESKPPASSIPTAPAIESITNTIGMKLSLIPAGTFMMGSPEDETYRKKNEHQHKVTISKAFYMQTTEVTQGQWKAVMGTEPWKGKQYVKEGPDYAATYVSWNEAVAYCEKLSEIEGKTYRLPTEAEWEYACRAGTETAWCFGDDEKELGEYAWYKKNTMDLGERYAHQVRLKKPNAFGLYDMHGNVWEWCHDYFGEDYYNQLPEKDPTGPAQDRWRVLRSGSWGHLPGTRSAYRDGSGADVRYDFDVGFRLVRELDDSSQSPPPPVPPTAPAIESITNTIGMKLNLIPAGTFMMGSPATETDRQDNETQHPVTISKAFYMQTTEVTQGQWKAVMGTEPWKGDSSVKTGPNYAASWLNWDDAVAYCKKLSETEGKTYRLPTEAEWEYACRAGTETRWSFGDDEKALGDYAWYEENSSAINEKYAHQVALKNPNRFGLYDMHGNVYEWCHDYYGEDYYQQSLPNDPTGPVTGSSRVLRGGSWDRNSRRTRSAFRVWDGADGRGYSGGFRLVREVGLVP